MPPQIDAEPSASSFCAGITLAFEAFQAELERLRSVSPPVQLSDGWRRIRRSLCELDARYGDTCLGQGDAGAAIVGGLPTGRPRADCLRVARTPIPAENRSRTRLRL
jgi:hypothetical protein